MLRNIPSELINSIRNIFNKCISTNYYPTKWKITIISMIPKSNTNLNDPNNWRAISIDSYLGKIFERIINNRLYIFVESNNIAKSGFRKHRSTKDNIVFLTQKVAKSIDRNKKVCCQFLTYLKLLIRFGGMGYCLN